MKVRVSIPRILFYYACAFAVISFAVYKPLPPGFCKSTLDRAIMHVIEPGLRVTYYWPSRVFFSTTSGMVWWTRLVLNNLSKLIGPVWEGQDSLHMETTHWEGVKVRVYSPLRNSSTGGAVIFIHGGGFALGNIEMYESLTRRIAKMLNSVVVSIDYRLSPETPFPGGLHDCEKVIEYFMAVAPQKYNVDTNKVVIMGDSAGGNLAAVITQRRRLHGAVPQLAGQVLIYPLMQMANLQSASYRYFQKNLEGFALVDPESVVLYYMFYAGIDMDKHRGLARYVLTNGHVSKDHRHTVDNILRYDEFSKHFNYSGEVLPDPAPVMEHAALQAMMSPWLTNPDFSPIMREDLSGLPKAFVMTCEYDVLRDEGIMYGRRLKAAGVPTTLRNYQNGFHAMLNFHYEIEEASASLRDIIAWTRDVLRSA